jgi:cold shock CspA family protein
MERQTGTIAVWISTRGFGYIVNEENFQKFFFHFSQVLNADKIEVGLKATFGISPIRDGKNLRAIDVEVLDSVVVRQ